MIYQAAQGEDLLHAQAALGARHAPRRMFFVLGPSAALLSCFLHLPAFPLRWARAPPGLPGPVLMLESSGAAFIFRS